MPLNDDQKHIVDVAVSSADHLRIRGRAGTGKTHTFKTIIQELKRLGRKTLTVTPTGAAACRITDENMGIFAQTIHRAMGFEAPVRQSDKEWPGQAEFLVQCALANKRTVSKIQNLETLLIDECSMVGKQMFETLDRIFREARSRPETPFGGVQVIFCGDFLQLPPVNDGWLFDSHSFKALNPKTETLTRIMRTDDPEYTDFQNYIRQRGVPVFGHNAARSARASITEVPDDALLLVHTNAEVDKRNLHMTLKLFPGVTLRTFPCIDQDGKKIDVKLCTGMKVMALANHPQLAYANSDIGHITGWDEDENGEPVAIVDFGNGKEEPVRWKRQQWETETGELHSRSWYPLKPAYAATINKIQGITADDIAVQCWNTGSHGRLFVALTRCRKLSGLKIILPNTAAMSYDTAVSDSEF